MDGEAHDFLEGWFATTSDFVRGKALSALVVNDAPFIFGAVTRYHTTGDMTRWKPNRSLDSG